MSYLKTNRRNYPGLENIDVWKVPEILGLNDETRQDYENKKSAIDQFSNGTPLNEIEKTTGITRQYLHYLLKRCTSPDKNGNPIGYSTLIKGKHTGLHRRNSLEKLDSGQALPGSLQALFVKYPTLYKTMDKLIVHGISPESNRTNSRLTWHHIHEIFLSQCNSLGISPPSYPFCSNSNGKFALTSWGKKILAESKILNVTSRETLDHLHENLRAPPSRCYERVEADGHYVDVNWTLEVTGLNGEGVVYCKVARLWLIALLEVKSTAVIGYSISLGRNYNASDVTRAIRSSLVPWQPRELTVSTISYKPGECLPNALMPELSYVCYDELWVDNAKSHLSSIFFTMLERSVNAVPVFGPKESPNVRPRIELLFDLLEEAGIHCLEGTTGSNPRDVRKSIKKNDRFILKLDTLLDLIDLLIVRYNTGIAPGTTISRNEVLKRAVMRETGIFRRIPKCKRDNCIKYSIFDEAVIGQERGRPILRWKNARYEGTGLYTVPNVIGQKVLVMANEDVREVEVVLLKDGTSLGLFQVEKRWRNTPHSLFTRTAVRRFMTNNSFISHAADIPLAFRAHVEKEVREKGRSQRTLARLSEEQKFDNKNVDLRELDIESSNSIHPDILVEVPEHEEIADDELDALISNLGTTYR